MKLIAYVYKEEPLFKEGDSFKLNISLQSLQSFKSSARVYAKNKLQIEELERMLEIGDNPIPLDYFKSIPDPYFVLVKDTSNNSVIALTDKGLISFMQLHCITTIRHDNDMYIKLEDDKIVYMGKDKSLAVKGLSDFAYVKTNNKVDTKIFSGIELTIQSGPVKVYGHALAPELKLQEKYRRIVNKIEGIRTVYVTKVIYEHNPNMTLGITVKPEVIEILDNIKEDVIKSDREKFGNIYSTLKSNKPILADFDVNNKIDAIEIVDDGVTKIIRPKDATAQTYTDKTGKTIIVLVNNEFFLSDDYDKNVVDIDYNLEPAGFIDKMLLSKDTFVIKTARNKGCRCRIRGLCNFPLIYKEKY